LWSGLAGHFKRYKFLGEEIANRTAAEHTPNLTDEERRHLAMDAVERKREAGAEVELDEFLRRVLYGDDKRTADGS